MVRQDQEWIRCRRTSLVYLMIWLIAILLISLYSSLWEIELAFFIETYYWLASWLFLLISKLLWPDFDDLVLLKQLALVRNAMIATHLGAIVKARTWRCSTHHELFILLVQQSLVILKWVVGWWCHWWTSSRPSSFRSNCSCSFIGESFVCGLIQTEVPQLDYC